MDLFSNMTIFTCLLLIAFVSYVKACGGDLYEEHGMIRSPHFHRNYSPRNNKCIWNIYAPKKGLLILNVTYYSLEDYVECIEDYRYLRIWDEDINIAPSIGEFCGGRIEKTIQSRSNVLRIEYLVHDKNRMTGFEIHFKTATPSKLTLEEIQYVSYVTRAKRLLSNWIVQCRKSHTKATNKWGIQAPRIACALYLNEKQLLQSHEVGAVEDELRYEITIQVLDKVSKIEKVSSQEIATFINGLLVTCLNPRDFHGYDLVAELRSRVEAEDYTNPFQILALCNANDIMTLKDIDRLELAFNSKRNRPLWFDTQAFSVLGLNCIMRKNKSLLNATSTLQSSMIQEFIAKQASNGTVGSFKDTALVLQALISTNSSDENFNVQAAIDSLLSNQQADGSFGSFLNSYYILPVLNSKSLIDISSDHCQEPKMNEIEALDHLKRSRKNMLRTLLSVWVGSDTDLGKTWTLKVSVNSSFYDAIELISSMDAKFKVEYSISDGKPYVSSVSGIEDDPELGQYWFTYVKMSNSSVNANFVKRSPADVIIEENQELILWYKEGM